MEQRQNQHWNVKFLAIASCSAHSRPNRHFARIAAIHRSFSAEKQINIENVLVLGAKEPQSGAQTHTNTHSSIKVGKN